MNEPEEETARRRDVQSVSHMLRSEQRRVCASVAKPHVTSDVPCRDVRELSLPATIENVVQMIEFVKHSLEEIGCPSKVQTKLAIVVDEIVSNIAKYAYGSLAGNVTVRFSAGQDEHQGGYIVEIAFIDKGISFNPLEAPRTNTAEAVATRRIGGQGILITRAIVDEIEYKRQGENNVLSIRKHIEC